MTMQSPASASHPASINPPSPIRLFVSHSWNDRLQRKLVVEKLRTAGYIPVCDADFISVGDELNKRILAAMEDAHGLVALLTKQALDSVWVREELTRAHSQHLRICALVEKAAKAKLPWFVRGTRYFEYTSQQDFAHVVDEFVTDLGTQRLEDYESVAVARKQFTELYRVWKREQPDTAIRRWQLSLAKRVIETAHAELSSLNTHQFSSIVGGGYNFLMRAKPVFENASGVYAVSLDTVSRFWVSPERDDQRIALQYWKAQPKRTYRLFVFSTPESAHNYATILNVHARKYGDTGGVFVCSTTAYKRLLDSIGIAAENQDFAALEYATEGGSAIFKATLDAERFSVIREPSDAVIQKMTDFKSTLLDLAKMELGQIDQVAGVMRWQTDLQKEPDAWAQALKLVFGSNKPDLFHMVFIARSALAEPRVKERLSHLMRELRDVLANIRSRGGPIQLKDFWVGDSCQVTAVDPSTGARIHNGEAQGFPTMLLMRFEDEDSLRNWYGNPEHSQLRRRVYELLDASMPDLFAKADSGDTDAARTYAEIETLASTQLARRDYRESDTIDDIVRRQPFRPSISFQE